MAQGAILDAKVKPPPGSEREAGALPAIGPPLLPFCLNVGITGHRAASFDEEAIGPLAERLAALFGEIERGARRVLGELPDCFADRPPRFRILSPLADGADQAGAEAALGLGWDLHAILPFDRGTYRLDHPGEPARARFDRLLERSTAVLELPGNREDDVEAYVMAGRATISHSDIIVAVWDGQPPRGRGGTGDVVAQALTSGTGVIHLCPKPDVEPRILWAGFDPDVLTLSDNRSVSRPFDSDHLDAMLAGLLLPPADPQEREFIRFFNAERRHAYRARIEYPLLLTSVGVRRMRAGDLVESHCQRQIDEEWASYRAGCIEAHPVSAELDLLQQAYGWADQLASHFAQTYRSGHIFSFVLGGAAVCLGLSAFMAPQHKLWFAAAEMVITFAIIMNAVIGTRRDWHRRWLDYRQLAERLRPMRSLELLGVASPDPPGTRNNPVARRWIEWYAGAMWRAIGAPSGSIDAGCAKVLARSIADHEVAPQVGYHQRNATLVETLDRRLELIGTFLFAATLIVATASLVGIMTGARYVEVFGDWFNLIEAGFPALGTAVFGIRFQADFGGDALRSMATAQTLERIDRELRGDVDLVRAADLAEQAARVMLSDLDEWRLINQQREIEMG